jgi:hypothetical protein
MKTDWLIVGRNVTSTSGTQSPEVWLGHPVLGEYKYGDLALQVGWVSNETVKYGHEFCGTLTQEWLLKLQTRPLVREGATK